MNVDGVVEDGGSENNVDAGCVAASRSADHVEGNCSVS